MAVKLKQSQLRREVTEEKQARAVKKFRVCEQNPSYIDRVLHLQRTVGNQEVNWMIRSGVLQAKLQNGRSGDIYEREADHIPSRIMRKPEINFSVVRSNQSPANRTRGKHQACLPAAPAPQRHRTLTSTAAQIAAMEACEWGHTDPDNLGIATETCRDGADWRLVVTQVNSVIRTYSRLLPGQAEPVPGVNTTAANFCNQATDLDGLGECAGNWYMIHAVRAHEDVHIDEWRDNFTTEWNPLETAIEALRVPASGATADRHAATAALRGMAVFQNAQDTSDAGGNFPTYWGMPDPSPDTNVAEWLVVDPRIRWICQYADAQGWNSGACPVC